MTPVVGIVLLVAITLLLAATVAAFALGIEDEQGSDSVPTVAVDFEYDDRAATDDRLSVVHKSGQSVDSAKLDVVIDGAECVGGGDPDGRYVATDFSIAGELTAGESFTIDGSTTCTSGTLDLSGASVQVVWNPETGNSALLRRWHGPN
jgi:FlaG/FlaF family flagellin (archaellin)